MKISRLKPLLLICCLLSVIVFSCKKEETDEAEVLGMSSALYAYQFKTGSYWVYKNDSTGVLDSVVVTSTETGTYWGPPPGYGDPGKKHSYYQINLKSFGQNMAWNYFLSGNTIKQNGGGEYGELGQEIYSTTLKVGEQYNGMELLAELNEITIGNVQFTKVHKVKVTASKQRRHVFHQNTELYFKDSFGLIKKVSNGTDSWSLVKWKVK